LKPFPRIDGDHHGPNKYAAYVDVHNSVIARLAGQGFVCFDETRFLRTEGIITLVGRIGCVGGLIVTVEKLLEEIGVLDGSPLVQTFKYAYNVSVQGYGNLVRFDNAHSHDGHMDKHHRHDFDPMTGIELPGSPLWIGATGWPNLGRVLTSLRDWHCDNAGELPAKHNCPDPDSFRNPPPAS
jgi:hypothetical protein